MFRRRRPRKRNQSQMPKRQPQRKNQEKQLRAAEASENQVRMLPRLRFLWKFISWISLRPRVSWSRQRRSLHGKMPGLRFQSGFQPPGIHLRRRRLTDMMIQRRTLPFPGGIRSPLRKQGLIRTEKSRSPICALRMTEHGTDSPETEAILTETEQAEAPFRIRAGWRQEFSLRSRGLPCRGTPMAAVIHSGPCLAIR